MSLLGDQHESEGERKKGPGLQVIDGRKKRVGPASRATAMNQHIKEAVIRLVAHSPIEFRDFGYVAKYAGTREDLAIAVVRDHIRELEARVPTPPRTPAPVRRLAA
jgi:hypothetical protein